jgi:hypothetical protein
MTEKKNPRKNVANELKALASGLDPRVYVTKADATNPYAFVVEHEGKTFRVIVKELDAVQSST